MEGDDIGLQGEWLGAGKFNCRHVEFQEGQALDSSNQESRTGLGLQIWDLLTGVS